MRLARGGDLEKYAADARALVRLVRDEIASVSPAGGCVVLRTQHDMLGSEDPTRNARRVEGNARTRAINAVIETIGEELNVPVFPVGAHLQRAPGGERFDGWCHAAGGRLGVHAEALQQLGQDAPPVGVPGGDRRALRGVVNPASRARRGL